MEQLSVIQKIEELAKKAKIAEDCSSPAASSAASFPSLQPSGSHADAQDSSEWEMLSNEVSQSGEERREREEEEAKIRDAMMKGLHEVLRQTKEKVVDNQCLSQLILLVGMAFVVLHLWNLVTHVM